MVLWNRHERADSFRNVNSRERHLRIYLSRELKVLGRMNLGFVDVGNLFQIDLARRRRMFEAWSQKRGVQVHLWVPDLGVAFFLRGYFRKKIRRRMTNFFHFIKTHT